MSAHNTRLIVMLLLLTMAVFGCSSPATKALKNLKADTNELARTNTSLLITPDIKANKLDDAVLQNSADNLLVSVSLASNGSSVNSDWWVAAETPFGWFYYDPGQTAWLFAGDSYTDLFFTYQGPLFDFNSFEILNISGLPVGLYRFYFGIDTNMNGLLDFDQLFIDFVTININEEGKTTYNISTAGFGNNITVKAGQTKNISFITQLPDELLPFTDISIDLNVVVKDATVNIVENKSIALSDNVSSKNASSPALVTIRIGFADTFNTVCDTGLLIGTYTIDLDNSNQPASVAPSTASFSSDALNIVNLGSFAVCTKINYPVDATISLDNVKVDTTSCVDTPAKISGIWKGTYSCTNTGCSNEGGKISMTITQDNNQAQYQDDNNASYNGTICGNVFDFRGGVNGSYTESGTFVLNPDGTATKTSSWQAIDGSCQGTCMDNLERQ